MKKFIALALSLILILCAASVWAEGDGKTEIGTMTVAGAFSIRSTIPEGYEYLPVVQTDLNVIATLVSEEDKPMVTISIGYNESYAETERFNDVDEDIVNDIRESFREVDEEVVFEDLETAYGTRLLKVTGEGFVDIYTIYKGYELEFVLTGVFTDDDVRMLVDFISDMDFVPVE